MTASILSTFARSALRMEMLRHFVRAVVASLLLFAAWMKLMQLVQLVPHAITISTVMLGILQSLSELLLGLWLLSNWRPLASWTASILCFLVFTFVAGSKLLVDEATCGCFGQLPISPHIAIAIDLAVLGALIATTPSLLCCYSYKRFSLLVSAAFCILVLVASAVAWTTYIDGTLTHALAFPNHDVVNWVGGQLPLLAYVQNSQALSSGEWRLYLVSSDCQRCRHLLDSLAHDISFANSQASAQVGIIDFAAQTPESLKQAVWLHVFHLASRERWMLSVPTLLILKDGIVTNVQRL